MRFIQVVLYAGNRNETYVETRVRLFRKQRKKTSMLLPPDEKSAKQAIYGVNYQVYIWLRCMEPISHEVNGWKYDEEDGYVKPVWVAGPQFPPSISERSKRKWMVEKKDVYEADCDENNEIKESKRKEGRQGNTIKEKAAGEWKSLVRESVTQIEYEESYDNVTCEMTVDESSEWERLSQFSDTPPDSSDSDWI